MYPATTGPATMDPGKDLSTAVPVTDLATRHCRLELHLGETVSSLIFLRLRFAIGSPPWLRRIRGVDRERDEPRAAPL